MPAGALISFVQKGLQYLELEANVAEVLSAAWNLLASSVSALSCWI